MRRHRARHDPTKSLVGFEVGNVSYALPIGKVREITNPLEIVPLPQSPDAVVGVSEYRGEVVPVVDLRRRFRLAAAAKTRKTKWIIVDVGDRLAAVIVDSVTGVFGTGGLELRAAPELGGGDDERGIVGVTSQDKQMTFILDTQNFRTLTDPLAFSGALSHERISSLLPKAGS